MKKLILIIFIYQSSFTLCSALQTNLDSLYTVWQDETQHDTIRATALDDFIWEGFVHSQPDSAYALTEILLAFIKDKNYPRIEARAYNMQGVSWKLKGDYIKALDSYSQCLNIREQMGDLGEIANSLYTIGGVYDDQNNYPKALDYFIRCLELYEQVENKRGMASTLTYIGGIYSSQGEYSKAREYFSESLKLDEQTGYQLGTAISLSNIGNTFSSQGDFIKARDYYNRALKIAKELKLEFGISANLGLIGSNYQKQGNFPKALDYFTQSLEIYEKIGVQDRMVFTLISIGEIYHELGDYSNALKYCQRGYKLAVSMSDLRGQKSGCQCLYETYKAQSKSNEALVYIEKIQVIDDSLDAEETTKKLQQMEFAKQVYQDSVETFEKERQVELAHQEEIQAKEKTRNIGFGISTFFVLLAIGFYGRWRYVKKSKAILQVEKDRSENLLLNILPEEIAEELKEKGEATARDFDLVSILFSDFKGFTELSSKLSASDLVEEINHCFKEFDGIMEKYNIEKIKTIGDAYMAAGGLPVPTNESVKNTVMAAIEMQDFIVKRKVERDAKNESAFEMRVGIHTGPVVAGIVGVKKFQYDIWGDTVNTASRMESSGQVGKVNISQATYELLKDDTQFTFESRGKIEAKGKGEIEMWFVTYKPNHA